MTEKRFTAFTDYLGGTQTILDNGERKTLQELLDTMNGLAEENKQLKFELKECREHKLFSRRQLEKENEQLKSENKNLKSNVDDLMNMELEDRDIVCQAGKFRLEEWGKHRLHQFYDGDILLEDETVVIRLMDLTTENEQLKQQVEDLEFALRTELAHQRVEKEEHSDSVYDFKKKLEKW